jgi:hypothetical protein
LSDHPAERFPQPHVLLVAQKIDYRTTNEIVKEEKINELGIRQLNTVLLQPFQYSDRSG